MNGLAIRRYRDADCAAVEALHHLALEMIGVDAGPGPWDADLTAIASVYLDGTGEWARSAGNWLPWARCGA
jgi:hypothetical protein